MKNSGADGQGETTAFPCDEDAGQPESAWCEDELTLDLGGGEEEEEEQQEETLTLEESYGMASLNNPDLWLYRDRTSAILRRYLRLAVEVGRLPALLGREFFRTRVTSYHTQTFEDTVIFVHDVERCLHLLNDAEFGLIAMIVMEEHPHWEAAGVLRCTRRTIVRYYGEALDRLSEIFLDREILRRLPKKVPRSTEACQGGETGEIAASA